MDIHGWLQGVTPEEQAGGFGVLNIPGFLIPKDNSASSLVKPRRARHANASSILEPAKLPSSGKVIERQVVSNAISLPQSFKTSTSDKENDEGEDKYIKKPRRKTRPEIYEPIVAANRPKAVNGSENKRKSVKDAGKKKKKRRLEAVDVRKFVAENVRANRLTVCAVLPNLCSTADIKAPPIE
jgi:hypothetical protein